MSPPNHSGSLACRLGPEDRTVRDRRFRPTPLLCRYTVLGGRRQIGRRVGETAGVFVDQHGLTLFSVALAIVALNILDAWFTVFLISHGGSEMNPIVQWILDLGIAPFIFCKSVGIGICLAFLTLTKNFRVSRIGLGTVLVGYFALLLWHLHLAGTLGLA